jgi:cysteinyl-tRNA synthetase
MALQVWNTRSGKLEPFEPIKKHFVGMYVCGLTPQDFTHVGHARCYIAFDTMRRYLTHKGFRVRYVQNYTDIDDKIINRAREQNVDPEDLAERFIEECEYDFGRLAIQPPDIQPRVTDHMDEIVETIRKLVDDGFAYRSEDGSVYFRVKRALTFGTLKHQSPEEMRVGARIEPDERKEDPVDFALWKAAKPGEPTWDSPWGPGRPGWHIECTAMSSKYLGAQFDVHGGGIDLIFPHHEAEIMQGEAYTGKVPFVKYWIHNGHVMLKAEKMSKSLGNFKTIREILNEWRPMELRFHLLNTHYRKPLEWDPQSLAGDAQAYRRLENAVLDLRGRLRKAKGEQDGRQTRVVKSASQTIAKAKRVFAESMDNDFNTRDAIAAVFELVRETNKLLEDEQELSIQTLNEVHNTFAELLGVLGLTVEEPAAEPEVVGDLLEYLLSLREKARARRDFKTADEIRDRLRQMGFEIEDSPKGPRWKRRA